MIDNLQLSPTEKQTYQGALDSIHMTFMRPITIFRKAEKLVIAQNPTGIPDSFNFVYPDDNQPATEISGYNINSGVFNARVWHLPGLGGNPMSLVTSDGGNEFTARGEPQLRYDNQKDIVRLKLDVTGYNFIHGSSSAEIDGVNYDVKFAPRQHGLFTPEFYTVWLEEQD